MKNNKLATERIYRLFELANENKDYSKRYIQLAKKIGEKTNTKIPKELKKTFCKKCLSLEIKKIEKNPFLIIKCEKCGFEKKYSLN
jgi:ribonuclease P protein subunit RPR2